MFKLWKRYSFTGLLFLSLLLPVSVWASSSCSTSDPCAGKNTPFDRVTCYTEVVSSCSSQRESMTAQIVLLTSKISLTSAKIESAKEKIVQTEKEIEEISGKIDNLEETLTTITSLFIDRVVGTYKHGGVSYFSLILGTDKFSDIFNRFKYFQTVQAHDRRILFQLQNSKVNFQEQKNLREEKKIELASLKIQLEKEEVTLASQKKEKELFLNTTKNNEAKYRQELEAARKEAAQIQKAASILSQAGVSKRVKAGDAIGLMGNTGFSTGSHLHLSVYTLSEADYNRFQFGSGTENPLGKLKSRSLPFDANSCDDVSSRTTKNVGSGSWNWPMSNPTISQCYGHTPWSWRYQSGAHDGMDMYDDKDIVVRAVEEGNAYFYYGGQSAGNGVFIFHPNGKMTLYWHLQN